MEMGRVPIGKLKSLGETPHLKDFSGNPSLKKKKLLNEWGQVSGKFLVHF